jgi:hypothetical protein
VTRALTVASVLVVLASLAGQFARYVVYDGRPLALARLFNVDAEQNVPTVFSVLLLFVAALLLALVAVLKRDRKEPDASRWMVLSAGFLYMSVDEGATVHELLINPVRALLGGGRFGPFYFAWVIPGIAVVAALGVFFVRFVRRLPAPTRSRFVLAGVLFLAGALGFEMIGGYWAEANGQ